jgi:hypothetical protein
MDLSDSEIIVDVELKDDVKGPAKFVCWCGMEIGIIRPLIGRRDFNAETRKKHKGEWFDSFSPHGFHATAEAAACDLIREYVKRRPESEVVQAALRKDYDFVREYRKSLVSGIEIVGK